MFNYKAIAFAGVILVGTSAQAEYGHDHHHDGYGSHYKEREYDNYQPTYHNHQYGDHYDQGYDQPHYYNDKGYDTYDYGYKGKKMDFKKTTTLFDPKEWWKLMSSYDQCKKHKCQQYGYESYEYSTDYKQMMTAVGNYVTCNVACGAATFVKATCKQSEYYSKMYYMAQEQLATLKEKNKDKQTIRDMHLKRGNACILSDNEFVDFDDLTLKVTDGTYTGYVSADDLLDYCDYKAEKGAHLPKELFGFFNALGVTSEEAQIMLDSDCSDALVAYLNGLKNGAGSDVLKYDCDAMDGSCTDLLQSNPRAKNIEESYVCEEVGVKFWADDEHHHHHSDYLFIENLFKAGRVVASEKDCKDAEETADVTVIRKSDVDEALKAYKGCDESNEIHRFLRRYFKKPEDCKKGNGKCYYPKDKYEIKSKIVTDYVRTHKRYSTVLKHLPSEKLTTDDVNDAVSHLTKEIMDAGEDAKYEEVDMSVRCKYKAGLADLTFGQSAGGSVLHIDASKGKIAKWVAATTDMRCAVGNLGYEFQSATQFARYLWNMITSDRGCTENDMADADSVDPTMVHTLKCAKRVYDYQCQCMNVVLNCFQEGGYYEGNVATKTIGKVFGLLCALLLCKIPRNFVYMNGVGAFRSAKMMKVVLAQANLLDAPSMSSLSPASFAFVAFGLGMVAFVVTQAVLKTRRGNVTADKSASKSLLAAQSTL